MRKSAAVLTFCLILGWAALGHAQNDARRRASGHARLGKQLESQGKYIAAVAEFQSAYKLVPHPVMFYNIALNYRLARRWSDARVYYEKYLAVTPSGKLADSARRALSAVRKAEAEQIAKRRAAEQERKRLAAEQERKRLAAEQERKRLAAEQERKRVQRANRKSEPDSGGGQPEPDTRIVTTPRSSGGGGMKLAGLITAGLGVVALGLGVKFGMDAQSISDELSRVTTDPWSQQELERQEEGKSAQTNQILFTAAGAAAIAGGIVMYILGTRAGKSAERLTVAPVVGPDRVGWAIAGHF